MVTKLLTQDFVFAALEAERNGEKFPISLDDVWGVLGYSNKRNAKRRLVEDLVEGEDFALLKSEQWSQDGRSGDLIGISTDGYKHFCLMARTKKGREIRKYFIEVEKEYRANLERQLQASLQPSTQNTSEELQQLQNDYAFLEQQIKVIEAFIKMTNNILDMTVGCPYGYLEDIQNASHVHEKVIKTLVFLISTHPEASDFSDCYKQ